MSPPFRTAASPARQVVSKPAASTTSFAAAGARLLAGGDPGGRAEPEGALAPLGDRIDDRDVSTGPRRDIRAEKPDRAAAEDGDLVAGREGVVRQRPDATGEGLGQHRAARIEAGGHRHERRPRHGQPLREDAGAVHPDQPPRGAQVVLARETALAGAAGDEREDRVRLPVDAADHLVAEDERWHARPGMPAIAVEVGAANTGQLDLEHDLAVGRFRVGRVLEPDVALAVPNECLHRPPLTAAEPYRRARPSAPRSPECGRR